MDTSDLSIALKRGQDEQVSKMDSEYFDTHKLADRTGIAASTWSKRRLTGDGPAYIKAGRRVLYRWPDVEAWFAKQVRTSTSDAA